MSSNYTGDSGNLTLPISTTGVVSALPDDGDDLTAASVGVAFENLHDLVDFIYEWTKADQYGVTQDRWYHPDWRSDETSWDCSNGNPIPNQVAENGIMWLFLDLPHDARVTNVDLYVDGGPSHVGLPTNKLKAKLQKYDPTTGTATDIGSEVLDPSVDAPAYEAPHLLSLPQDFTVDRDTYTYQIKVTGEGSTNWQPNATITGILVAFHQNTMDQTGAG